MMDSQFAADKKRVREAVSALLGPIDALVQLEHQGAIQIVDSGTMAVQAAGWTDLPVVLPDLDQPTVPLRKWFGASVVTDHQGEPLTVFHGTTAEDFSVFDINMASPASRFGPGFYFSRDEQTLDVYSKAGRLVPVHLRIERPQVSDALSVEQVHLFFDSLQDKVFSNGFDARIAHEQARELALEDLDRAFAVLLSTQICYISQKRASRDKASFDS